MQNYSACSSSQTTIALPPLVPPTFLVLNLTVTSSDKFPLLPAPTPAPFTILPVTVHLLEQYWIEGKNILDSIVAFSEACDLKIPPSRYLEPDCGMGWVRGDSSKDTVQRLEVRS